MTAQTPEPVKAMIRRRREHHRRSQLDVALATELSTRQLSFVETGRATPSREMIERIRTELDVPLRERNLFHLAAGYAPPHTERSFADLGAARTAVETLLAGHDPNPALVVNVCWELVAANPTMTAFLGDLPAKLVEPPLNVLRATLHPDGPAPRIRNFGQWRAHVVWRVRRQLERTAARPGSPSCSPSCVRTRIRTETPMRTHAKMTSSYHFV